MGWGGKSSQDWTTCEENWGSVGIYQCQWIEDPYRAPPTGIWVHAKDANTIPLLLLTLQTNDKSEYWEVSAIGTSGRDSLHLGCNWRGKLIRKRQRTTVYPFWWTFDTSFLEFRNNDDHGLVCNWPGKEGFMEASSHRLASNLGNWKFIDYWSTRINAEYSGLGRFSVPALLIASGQLFSTTISLVFMQITDIFFPIQGLRVKLFSSSPGLFILCRFLSSQSPSLLSVNLCPSLASLDGTLFLSQIFLFHSITSSSQPDYTFFSHIFIFRPNCFPAT